MSNKYDGNLNGLLIDKTFDATFKKGAELEQQYSDSIPNLATNLENFEKWIKLEILSYKYDLNLQIFLKESLAESSNSNRGKSLNKKFWKKRSLIGKTKPMDAYIVITNAKKIKEFLANPSLSKYKRYMEIGYFNSPEKAFENQNNNGVIPNNPAKRILANLNKDIGKFADYVRDSKGKIADYKIDFATSDDRIIRKNAWINTKVCINNIKNTYAELFYGYNFRSNEYGRQNQYKGYIDQTISKFEFNYQNFIKIINGALETKDMFLRFRQHNQDIFMNLNGYDEYLPGDAKFLNKDLVFDYIPIEIAKETILESLKPLGDNYLKIVNDKVFSEHWIDWVHAKRINTEKNYSGSTYGICPINVDYQYSNASVITTIHEIGHSVCNYLSQINQQIYSTDNELTSEIASYVNEMLCRLHGLDKYKNNSYSLFCLIKNMLSRFYESVSDYAIFEKFRMLINTRVNQRKKSEV